MPITKKRTASPALQAAALELTKAERSVRGYLREYKGSIKKAKQALENAYSQLHLLSEKINAQDRIFFMRRNAYRSASEEEKPARKKKVLQALTDLEKTSAYTLSIMKELDNIILKYSLNILNTFSEYKHQLEKFLKDPSVTSQLSKAYLDRLSKILKATTSETDSFRAISTVRT